MAVRTFTDVERPAAERCATENGAVVEPLGDQ